MSLYENQRKFIDQNHKGRTLGDADLAAAMLLQLPKHLIQIAGLDVAHPGTAAAAAGLLPVLPRQQLPRQSEGTKYTKYTKGPNLSGMQSE